MVVRASDKSSLTEGTVSYIAHWSVHQPRMLVLRRRTVGGRALIWTGSTRPERSHRRKGYRQTRKLAGVFNAAKCRRNDE